MVFAAADFNTKTKMFSRTRRDTTRKISFDSRLISLIKERPLIYDKKSIEYRNTEFKDAQWKKIAAELDTDVERCKKRWGSLRDRYKRIRRHELMEGTGMGHHNRWRYYEVLRFIPYYDDSNTAAEYCQNDDTIEDTNTMVNIAERHNITTPPKSNRKRDRALTGYLSNFADDIKEPDSPNSDTSDATDHFFSYIAQRIKLANLTSFEEMQVEAAILNYTIAKIAKIQNET